MSCVFVSVQHRCMNCVHPYKFSVLNVEEGVNTHDDDVSAVPAVPVVAQPVCEDACGGDCCVGARKDGD